MSLALAKAVAATRVPEPYRPLCEVVELLGCSARWAQRLCNERWGPEGLAELFDGVWGVHPAADPRLRAAVDHAKRDREQIAELSAGGVAPLQIDTATAKRDILNGLADFECDAPCPWKLREFYIAQLFADKALPREGIKKLSARTLYRWEAQYKHDGIRGLVRKLPATGETDANGNAAMQYVFDLVHGGNGISLAAAITVACGKARKHGNDPAWKIGSYSGVREIINARSPRILKVFAGKGERHAIADCVPKGRRDFESIPSNAEWVGDERTLDVWCRVLTSRGWKAVRPKITAWTDMRSRMVVGWVLDIYADSNTILASIKIGISKHGKPVLLRVDWGADYKKATGSPHSRRWKVRSFDGQRIGSVLDELHIEVNPVMPYTPWSKPIESFFKTMKEHLDKLFAAFWGGCPSERHEDRHHYLRDNLENLATLDELREAVAAFIDVYHRTPHSAVDMFGKSPLEAMEAFRDGPAQKESETVLDHYFQEYVGPKLVRRDGIRHYGRWYGHGDPRVVALQGKKVLISIQPDDAGYAMVCDIDRKPKFRVECAPLRGFTPRDAADIGRRKARLLRPYRQQIRDAKAVLAGTPPTEHLANRLAGIEAVHGKREPAETTPPQLTIRPALEGAIANAGPAPFEQSSIAARTGTDDHEITVDDMLADDDREPVSAWQPDGDADDTDFFGLDDIGA